MRTTVGLRSLPIASSLQCCLIQRQAERRMLWALPAFAQGVLAFHAPAGEKALQPLTTVAWELAPAAQANWTCGAGQRNADASECLAAVVAAAGGKANGHIKHVDTPLVPPGCSYSHVSGAALFNSAGQVGSSAEDYQLVCATSTWTDSASPSTQDSSSEPAGPEPASKPVVLGATETSCYVTENNAQLFANLASACAAYKELVVVLNVFDSDGDDSVGRTGKPSRSLNCAAELIPNVTLPACVREVTHVPGMKTAFWRYAALQ
jgi:hypothetical protein